MRSDSISEVENTTQPLHKIFLNWCVTVKYLLQNDSTDILPPFAMNSNRSQHQITAS